MNDAEQYWHNDWISVLQDRKKHLLMLVESKNKAIKASPNGNIIVRNKGNSFQYYLRSDTKDKNGIYIHKGELDKAKRIAQRGYDATIIDKAKKELVELDKYIKQVKESNLNDVYDSLSGGRKKLITPLIIPDEQYVASWESKIYDIFEVDDSVGEFVSNNGIRVRSKVELIIANALEYYNIPFRYEYPLILKNNYRVRPDFFCLNVKKRKEIVWEHFGMMDSEEYANKNIDKIQRYEQSGFHAGDNFIMTFESSLNPLSSKIIKNKIETYLF
ncbi:hypothetical protein [Butyrivibrio proteoclasticus]|uniref:hypothetical protein n=1 Tax=Butyrivibrio proteoclasticus TaxID=43305 RepID=UPI00047D5541|nr:hypothetical protein [Butyrivibrio proteoclasticus]